MRRQIKQREAAERALNDQLEFMRALLNGTPHPMYVRDRDGLLQSCNDSYLEAVEAQLSDVLGKRIQDSTLGDSCYASQIQADYQKVMHEGIPLIVDRPLLLKERELTIYHWILPYRDSLGEVQGIIGGWIDISERRQLIQDLRLAKQRADDANRAKSVFLATISHEIRTPMNAIIGMLELTLKRADQGHIDRPAIEVAYNSAKELLALIGDILDMARIESGHLTLAPEPVNLAELVESVGRVFDGVARQKDLLLRLEIAPQAHCEVLLDPLRFKQILSNLVSNAIKFTEKGQVTVHLALEPGPAANRPTLRVTVQDSGIGISPQDQQRLFLPFAQANPDSNLARSGTGLGLAISRDLCQSMGGNLTLHSVLGQGTHVHIGMPMTLLAETPKPAPAPPEPCAVLPPLRVLVIDDHPANLLLIAQQLTFLGLEHASADNGLSGLSTWRQGQFDVVIVDCNMPQLNGYQFTQAARDHERQYQWVPCTILGYTANAQPEVRERCRQVGMDDCLLKPISLNALSRRLAEAPLLAAQPPAPAPLPFDLQGLEPVVGKSMSDLRQLLEELLRSFKHDRASLKAIDPLGDAVQLMNQAHKILGPARIIQADSLIQACEQLEADCQSNQAASVLEDRQQQLLSVLSALEDALQGYLHAQPAQPSRGNT